MSSVGIGGYAFRVLESYSGDDTPVELGKKQLPYFAACGLALSIALC